MVRGQDRSHRGMRVSYAARCGRAASTSLLRSKPCKISIPMKPRNGWTPSGSGAPWAQARRIRSSVETETVRIHGRDRSHGEREGGGWGS